MLEGGAAHDEGEGITDCREFTLDEFTQMVASGEISAASSLCLYARLCARELV